jgi:hypothetical protein
MERVSRCELSEGGSPKRNLEGDEGDLCWKHKGLAEFLKFEERIKNKCVKCRERRHGVDSMNTLDLQKT